MFDCVLLHLGYFTFLLLLSTSNNVFDCIFLHLGCCTFLLLLIQLSVLILTDSACYMWSWFPYCKEVMERSNKFIRCSNGPIAFSTLHATSGWPKWKFCGMHSNKAWNYFLIVNKFSGIDSYLIMCRRRVMRRCGWDVRKYWRISRM